MNNLEGLEEEFYSDNEVRVEDQDIRLLKALVSDEHAARELANVYDANLFVGDARMFAEKAIKYFKIYSQLPTRRVMSGDVDDCTLEKFDQIWNLLASAPYQPSEFEYDLDKIKERFTKLQIIKLKDVLIDDIDCNSNRLEFVLKTVRANLDYTDKIRRGKEQAYIQKTLKEYMPEFREEFIKKTKDPELGRGVFTGYSYIDYITNGLRPSDMLIIGGETGAGKSMLLANMAKQMWMQNNTIDQKSNFTKGYNILYFSLEMPYAQCARRTLSSMADIATYALRDCQISDPVQLGKLADAANFIKNYPYEFEVVDIPRGVTIHQIEERFLESVARGKMPEIVIVDYLGLMDDTGEDGDDWLRLGKIAGKLHEFGRMYNVIVLTAVQLNRPKTKDPRDAIGMHRIGRSSQIMHHATIGVQILTRENEDSYADLEYHVIKNRDGEMGSHNIKKKFKTATLVDYKDDDGKGYIPNSNTGFIPNVNVMEDISDKLSELGW
ncbi:MAG: DnaB-like helicase C-terminal domain-containing protein [bacterium]|nr:DnaB-like helicase C-terminal domain-containing protein [bacterium]